jgi:ABC-type uncharacterized transport system substrate-binding protein
MRKSISLIILAAVVLVGAAFLLWKKGGSLPRQEAVKETPATEVKKHQGKKILFINSYHAGYEWSDGEIRGAQNALKDDGVELKVIHLDTKNNPSPEFAETAATAAKETIEQYQPDVVITADDPALKYLIMPHYKNASLPVVFCGVNWDASVYGIPYSNTTGMTEVAATPRLIEILQGYAKGDKIGFIAGNTQTDKINAEYYKKLFNINLSKTYHVDTFAQWKEVFADIQKEVDMLILENNAGIKDWDNQAAESFVLEEIKIPTGSLQKYMANYALIAIAKDAEEQGAWAAQAALKILDGAKPSQITPESNKKGILFANLKIAGKLNVVLKPEILKNAQLVK